MPKFIVSIAMQIIMFHCQLMMSESSEREHDNFLQFTKKTFERIQSEMESLHSTIAYYEEENERQRRLLEEVYEIGMLQCILLA